MHTTAHNCTRHKTTSPDRTLGEGAFSVLHVAICLFNESNTSTLSARVNTSTCTFLSEAISKLKLTCKMLNLDSEILLLVQGWDIDNVYKQPKKD